MIAPTAHRTMWVATHVVEIIWREGGPIESYGLMLGLVPPPGLDEAGVESDPGVSAWSAKEWNAAIRASWSLRDGQWLYQGATPPCASFGVVRLP